MGTELADLSVGRTARQRTRWSRRHAARRVSGVLGVGHRARRALRGIFGGLAAALAFTIWQALRRTVVEPRVGYVRLQPARSRRIRGLRPSYRCRCDGARDCRGFLAHRRRPSDGYLVPGYRVRDPRCHCGLLRGAGSLVFLCRRDHGRASFVDSWYGGPADWLFWPSGTIIVIAGAVMLLRFLRRYPGRVGDGTAGP